MRPSDGSKRGARLPAHLISTCSWLPAPETRRPHVACMFGGTSLAVFLSRSHAFSRNSVRDGRPIYRIALFANLGLPNFPRPWYLLSWLSGRTELITYFCLLPSNLARFVSGAAPDSGALLVPLRGRQAMCFRTTRLDFRTRSAFGPAMRPSIWHFGVRRSLSRVDACQAHGGERAGRRGALGR